MENGRDQITHQIYHKIKGLGKGGEWTVARRFRGFALALEVKIGAIAAFLKGCWPAAGSENRAANGPNREMNAKVQTAFGSAIELRARIVDRMQQFHPVRRKVVESLGLWAVLAIIYSFYLQALWSIPACRDVEINAAYLLVLLKFLVLTGWPFALLASLDNTWTSTEAGRIFLAAFIATNEYWMRKYHHSFCLHSFAFEVFPFVFSAVVGHAIGAALRLNKESED